MKRRPWLMFGLLGVLLLLAGYVMFIDPGWLVSDRGATSGSANDPAIADKPGCSGDFGQPALDRPHNPAAHGSPNDAAGHEAAAGNARDRVPRTAGATLPPEDDTPDTETEGTDGAASETEAPKRLPVARIGGLGRTTGRWSLRMAMNHDGSLAASFGPGTVTVWSADSAEAVWSHPCAGGYRSPGMFSPDGRHVACVSEEDHAMLRLASTGEPVWTHERKAEVSAIRFQPRGEQILIGYDDGSIIELSVADGQLTREIAKLDGSVKSLLVEPVHGMLVVCTQESVYTIAPGGEPRLVFAGDVMAAEIVLSPDGQTFMHGAEHGQVHARSIADGSLIKRHEFGDELLVLPPVSAGSENVLIRVRDHAAVSLRLCTFDGLKPIDTVALAFIIGIAGSGDGRRAVTPELSLSVRFWSLEGGKIKPYGPDQGKPVYAAWFPDGRRLLVGDQSGEVSIKDAETLAEIESFKTTEKTVDAMLLSPRGDKLLIVDTAGLPTLWDIASREHVVLGAAAEATLMEFSADGSLVFLERFHSSCSGYPQWRK